MPPICMYALTRAGLAGLPIDLLGRATSIAWPISNDHYRSVARFIGDDASSARRENLITFYDSVPAPFHRVRDRLAYLGVSLLVSRDAISRCLESLRIASNRVAKNSNFIYIYIYK